MRDSELQDSKESFDLGGHELCIMFACLQQPRHVLRMKKVELEIPFLGKLRNFSEFKNDVYNN